MKKIETLVAKNFVTMTLIVFHSVVCCYSLWILQIQSFKDGGRVDIKLQNHLKIRVRNCQQ